MNLDQLTIAIRPRRAWEAVDLGLLMARRWWWPMTKVWLVLTLPLFALLNLLPGNWLWLSYTLIWWLKPLFERPLLHILSQAVFNQTPNTRSTLKAFPELARRQVFMSLTWRRLSPSRSMDLPVIHLEGLHGARRRERLAILHREESNPSTWLTIIGAHLEVFLGLGMAMLLYALIPSEIHIDWLALFTSQDAAWFVLLMNSCNYLAMTLVAPFYVACGFALYLNRRINLEAWDIDIAFQRIVTKRRSASSLPLVMVMLIISWGFGQTPNAVADVKAPLSSEPAINLSPSEELKEPPKLDRDNTKITIEAILADETFHQKQVIRYPEFFDSDLEEPKNGSDFWKSFFDLFKSAEQFARVASGLEMLLWAGVICLIFLVVFRYRHWLAAYLPSGLNTPVYRAKPVTLFGMDLARESLPDDISATALALWQQGEQRSALALLYRASLSRLLDGGLDIDDGHTEEECLQAAEQLAVTRPEARQAVNYFARLTRLWQRLAYGHIAPDALVAEQVCREWNAIWEGANQSGGDHGKV